jgi:hypothetical protein
MMFTWCALRARDGRIEIVDRWPTLDEVLREMSGSSWEEPGNRWLSYVTDSAGQVVATAIFGPDLQLLVTLADGRQLCFPQPKFYREMTEKAAAVFGERVPSPRPSGLIQGSETASVDQPKGR